MLNYICNKCGEEIKTKDFYAELTIREIKSIFIPGKVGGQELNRKMTEKVRHYCQECIGKMLSDDKHKF